MDEQRAWLKSRRRKRLRIVAVILCVCLFVTARPDILAALSSLASEWKDSTVYVSGFGELSAAVREQTVPLGTGVEELSLPDTLEAFVAVSEEEDPTGDADKPGDESGDAGTPGDGEGGAENPGDGEGGTENPGDGTGESGNPDDGTDGGSGDAGNPGDGSDGGNGDAGSPGDGTDGGSGDAGNPGDGSDGGNGDAGSPGDGTGDGSGDAGNPGEGSDDESGGAGNEDGGDSGEGETEAQEDSAPADEEGGEEAVDETAKADCALTARRGVFVMPVYLSEPVDAAEPQTMEKKEESVMIKGVTWQSEPAFDGSVEGTYVFMAVLPEGYALAEGVSLPQITVTVQGTDPVVEELLTRIAALPEAEDCLAEEPDVEEEEAYEAWMEALSSYAAEALDLWELYETLTEEQRAQIPTEALVKLAAWVELAGQLAEGSQVMASDETVTITVNLYLNGSPWSEQNVTLRRESEHFQMMETGSGTGVYKGTVEKGGRYFPCLDGNSIGGNYLEDSGGTFTFHYVTVTYETEGATGNVPEKENYYCGRVNRDTPMKYTVKTNWWLTKEGYVQNGWSETRGGGSDKKITEIIVNQGNGNEEGIRKEPIILYPVFEPATVTIRTENCMPEGLEVVENGVYKATVGDGDYAVTFVPDAGYGVPTYVIVKAGNRQLASSEYTYEAGVLTIPRSKITGNVYITARAGDSDGWIPFGETYSTKWKLEGNTLMIGGNGPMPDWAAFSTPWEDKRTAINTVVIESGVTKVGNYAFNNFASLTSATIPDTVTSIGQSGFGMCKMLESVTIPGDVTDIGGHAFEACAFTSVTIPGKVESIGEYAFSGTSLQSVAIPGSVKRMGNGVFNECSGLVGVDISDGVTSIGGWMFRGCTSLTSVTIPGSVRSIGSTAFSGCTSLTSVVFQDTDTIPTLGTDCFKYCPCVESGAKGLVIPTCEYLTKSGWDTYKDHVQREGEGSLHQTPLTKTDEIPAGCGTEGQEAYWTCEECGTLFSDAAGTTVIEEPEVIPATGHTLTETPKVEATCESPGTEAYWTCSVCGKLFSDADGSTSITDPVTIPATGHALTYTANDAADTITQSCSNGCGHSATAVLQGDAAYTYTGSEIRQFLVQYPDNKSAWRGTEPEISYTGDCTDAGTKTAAAALSVPGTSVSVSRTFTIEPKALTEASVTAELDSDSYPFTGQAITPGVTVRDTARGDGVTLAEGTDYTVAYQNNTAVSTDASKAQVVLTGKGNYAGTRTVPFTIKVKDTAPEVSAGDLDLSGGTVKLPDGIKDQVEVYTDPNDPEGSKLTLKEDGSLPDDVEPGTTIYIRYPGSDKPTKVEIPPRPAKPELDEGKVEKTDTTIKAPKPDDGEAYEYVLVEKGEEPDWSNPNTTGEFTGLDPNKEYDLYMRKAATKDSFASEPVKTEIRTSVTIKKPETGGDNAEKDGNAVSGGEPSAGGESVTYTGTCEEGSTPVITVDGKEIVPEITWGEDGKGTWSVTVPVKDGEPAVEIQVEFKNRVKTGLEITETVPGSMTIYADNGANQSAEKLLDYLKKSCTIKITYDNGASDDATFGADYTTQTDFSPKGAVYEYAVEADGNTENPGKITLTVKPVTASVKTPDALSKGLKPGGYTKAEVEAWLPASVTVSYTGDGDYKQRMESRPVTWDTDALGADFGAAAGSKTISGTVDMPAWATLDGKGNTASIGIAFVDRNTLTDDQMNLSVSGWTYGEQTAPAPKGSVTVTDTEQTYSYRYSADNGRSWVTADKLPKSGSGNIIPGDYQVQMTYSGRNYTGMKTAAFTVVQKPVTAEKGTLAVADRKYDGTTNATLKAGGKPALVGVVGNDDVALDGTLKAVFTNKGPKKDIPVTVTGFALAGRDAGYYKLINTTLTLKATINKKDSGSSSGGSSGGDNGNNSGDSGTGGSGDNGNSGGDSGNSGNTGTGGSSGTGGNKGTGGNTGGNGGTTGTGSSNGTGGSGKGSTGSGNTSGTGKGSSGTGNGKGSIGSGNTTGTGKGSTGKGNTTGTGKGGTGNGSTTDTGKGSTGQGGTGNGSTSGTGKGSANGTGNGTTGNGKDSTGSGSGRNGSTDSGTGNGDTGAQQAGDGQQPKSVTVQTVQAETTDGRIVLSGETEAPVAIGTLTEDAPGSTRLLVGEGTVTVTVVCEDDQYTVGMNDATAVANAVLTPEQITRVDAGESLEIRVDIKNISQSIPPQDRETVEKGYEAYGKYLPELMRGGYVDISVYTKTGEDGWNAVSETTEPLEVVIGIPEGLRGDDREYYIIRAHEGKYTLLNDMDAAPETITIVTDLFSSYAIAYREAGGANAGNGETAYGMFPVSPRFLGIVSLIWLAAAVTGIIVVIIVLRRKKGGERERAV